jgi:hypothetical protein
MGVKVYEASWAATRGLSRTLRDNTADNNERCMVDPPDMVERVHTDLSFTESSAGIDNRYGTHKNWDEAFPVSKTVL